MKQDLFGHQNQPSDVRSNIFQEVTQGYVTSFEYFEELIKNHGLVSLL